MKIKSLMKLIILVICLNITAVAQSGFCIPALMYHIINDDYDNKNADYKAGVSAGSLKAGVNREGENPFLTKRITVYGHMSATD